MGRLPQHDLQEIRPRSGRPQREGLRNWGLHGGGQFGSILFFLIDFFSIHSYLGPNQLIVEDINIEFHDILLSDPKAS